MVQISPLAGRAADGVRVPHISTLLEAGRRVSSQCHDNWRLQADLAYQGCVIVGKGFILDLVTARAWIDA